MSLTRRLQTNGSKGELSPLIEGRPDLAAYFEGFSKLENFLILRQGGVDRRLGTRFISEIKDSSKDAILIPFIASTSASYVLELGPGYIRFYKDKQQLVDGLGAPIEVATPYTEDDLRNIHYTQSVDVLTLFCGTRSQQRISRISDTNWSAGAVIYIPPPSFEADSDISLGVVTLTPAATTGSSITFTASSNVFLFGDVGRQIIYGASRAIIKSVASAGTSVTADIIDAFPNTLPIPAGSWFLRLSPQTTLDPDRKEPVGAQVTFTAGAGAFRSTDVGKFIKIYAGLAKITNVDSATSVRAELLSVMTATSSADPSAAPAGAWTLEVPSWSTIQGFPKTGDYFQGRLGQASTDAQKTAWWLSSTDNFDDYSVGIEATKAIEYTIASRQLNEIVWMIDNKSLFIGTTGAEFEITSGKSDEAFGGDKVPLVERASEIGSARIQPTIISKRIIFVDSTRKQIFSLGFQVEDDGQRALELTGAAEHISGSGIRLGPTAFSKRQDPRIYYIREDGQLIALTYFLWEKVIGFSRLVTDGTYESVASIPQVSPKPYITYVIVKRGNKKFVEVFDGEASELSSRQWQSLQTDCAVVASVSVPTSVLTGLGHLEGKTVDLIIDGVYRGTQIVDMGQVTSPVPAESNWEVGLHYDSELITMRPAIEGQMVEGLPRSWIDISARVYKTYGGLINGYDISYVPPVDPLAQPALLSQDVMAYAEGSDTEGRITIKQDKPYPMTVLAIFGEIEFGDHA